MTTFSIYGSNKKFIASGTLVGTTKTAAKAQSEDLAAKMGVDFAYFVIADNAKHKARQYTRDGKLTNELFQ